MKIFGMVFRLGIPLLFTACTTKSIYYPILEIESSNYNVISQVSYQINYSGYEIDAYKFLVEIKNKSAKDITISPAEWVIKSVQMSNDTSSLAPRFVSTIDPNQLYSGLISERQAIIQDENPYKSSYIPGEGTVALIGLMVDDKYPPSEEEQDRREQAEENKENQQRQNALVWEQDRQSKLERNRDLSETVLQSSLYQTELLQPESTIRGYVYFPTMRNVSKLELIIPDDEENISFVFCQKE